MQSATKNKPQSATPPYKKRPARVITAEYLEKAALFYLQRYASSRENVRKVLMRRLMRAGVDRDPNCLAMVAAVIEKLGARGLLDDRNYAWHRIQSLTQSGKSWRRIEAHLQSKGVSREDIEAALEKLRDDDPDMEWNAAMKFARRKKIGPFRTREVSDPARELRQLAAAGFSYSMAKKIIDTDIDND